MRLQPSQIANLPFRSIRSFLYAGVAILIALVVTTALVALIQLHDEAEKRAVITSQNLAKSLELTFNGLIDTINMALLSSSNEISHQISYGKPNASSINRMLAEQKQYIDHVTYIRATNEKGDVIYGGLSQSFNISERDYFIRLRDDPTIKLYVAKPLQSIFTHKWVWIFARRVTKPDGSFGGVVYAPIPVEYVDKIFAQMDVDHGSSIALRDADLGLIARYAPVSKTFFAVGDKRLSDEFIKALQANPREGTYISGVTSIDGTVRLHTYQRNAKYGFIVNVGMCRDAMFAEWRKQAWIIGGVVATFILALLGFSRAINRGWKRQEQAIASLQTSRRSLQDAQKIANLGQFTYDLRADRWASSDILDEILGIDSDYEHSAQGWLNLVAIESRQEMQAYLNHLIEQRLPFDRSYRIVRPSDGKERWVYGKAEWLFDDAGRPIELLGTIQDITKNMLHEAELQHVANYDILTELPNRRLLAERLKQAVAYARCNSTYLAVCYLDLDEFKPINDLYGHEIGDKLLIAIARSLNGVLREDDTLARIGGDEFVLLFGDFIQIEEIYSLLDRVIEVVNTEVRIEDAVLRPSVSIGVTLFPEDDVDADTLLRHADYAMYCAKEAGKNRFQLFDPEHERQVQKQRDCLHRLCEALKNDEFVLHYQPKVDLLNGEIIGAEALIRWQHPDQGLLPPGEFLHYIEDSHLETDIGEWVIESVLSQIEAWNAIGLSFSVSANISASHLLRPDFTERLTASLQRHPGVDPSSLELEILETAALSDMDQAVLALSRCREYGVRIALDDFGTGYSSLTYFRKLPFDTLKIDQSFVRDMLDNPDDLDLVRNVVQLAHAFNRPVIAEGVETLEHGAMLLRLGCRYMQGYGISRPMPAEQMPGWMSEWLSGAAWLAMSDQLQLPSSPASPDLHHEPALSRAA